METVQIAPEQQLKIDAQKNKVLTALHPFDASTRFADNAFNDMQGMNLFVVSVGKETDLLKLLDVVRNKLRFKVLVFNAEPTRDGITHLTFVVRHSK